MMVFLELCLAIIPISIQSNDQNNVKIKFQSINGG